MPFPADSWLDVVPTPLAERDYFRWEDSTKHPQPLCHEPLWSVWSPDSPSPIEELDEMDLGPSTRSSSRSSTISSLWSLESLPVDQQDSDSSPRQADDDRSWMISPDHQDDNPSPFVPVPPSFSRPAHDRKVPHNHDWDDRGYLPPASPSPEDWEELLRPPSSPRSPLVNLLDLPLQHCEDYDDDYNTSALSRTPNRRTSLPELEDDFGHISPSSTILNLPGPGTDNTVMDFHRDLLEIDLTSPPLPTRPTPPDLYDGPVPGLCMASGFSNAAQSPSSEYTHVDNVFTHFPEPEKYDIPNTNDTAEDLGLLHPDYHLVRPSLSIPLRPAAIWPGNKSTLSSSPYLPLQSLASLIWTWIVCTSSLIAANISPLSTSSTTCPECPRAQAVARCQTSLLCPRPHGCEAYPDNVFVIHPLNPYTYPLYSGRIVYVSLYSATS